MNTTFKLGPGSQDYIGGEGWLPAYNVTLVDTLTCIMCPHWMTCVAFFVSYYCYPDE